MIRPADTRVRSVSKRLDGHGVRLLLACAGLGCCAACGGGETPPTSAGIGGGNASVVGGANGSAGSPSANTGGGSAVTGGATSTGGSVSSGGSSILAGGSGNGGASWSATGGSVSTGGKATGGSVSTGGRATGGTPAGGAGAIGGSPAGGKAASGGATTGGVASTSGGASTGGSAAGSGAAGGGTGTATKSAGCGKTPTLTSGLRSIQSGGQSRSYTLRIPENYDNSKPYRLIFAFHWNGGTANDIDGGGSSGYAWSYYGLREQANDSTIFVAPQGIGNGWANSGGRDLTLVDELVKLIEGDLCVDTSRLFALGFSYGGGMSYAIACARATVFRAVAVYSGAQLSGCEGGTQPIAYLGIHGISDGTCTIAGGRSLRNKFVTNNGCTAQNPPEPSGGSLTHTCTSYAGCSSGHPVRWCAFDGGHTPGPVDGGGDDGARTWTKGEVWKFFSQF